MGKFSGFGGGGAPGGGGGSMQQLMKQAQKMQEEMEKAKEELADTEVVATASGGLVEVVLGCDYKLTSIKIKPEVVDPEDVEMLEDMIAVAFSEALRLVEEEKNRVLGPFGQAGLL
ncbi:MAG: YbaB/EbfC family nucleoid-associated protein [Christensenellaceae bacterium]|jgi:DNA-binding YbaB/EbfC family protein|nr:YbaB/EbfC family nucleoid-associated protein [Christensenellaceae bacterium]